MYGSDSQMSYHPENRNILMYKLNPHTQGMEAGSQMKKKRSFLLKLEDTKFLFVSF